MGPYRHQSRFRGWRIVPLLGLTVSCGDPVSQETSSPVGRLNLVYGVDGRQEVYEAPVDPLSEAARRSVLALIPDSRLKRQPDGRWQVDFKTAGERHSLCAGEAYAEQPSAAECSGTLIDRDLVLTAAHCAGIEGHCSAMPFVFNYWYQAPGELAEIDDRSIYHCASMGLFQLEKRGDAPIDIAIVVLDRPVHTDFVAASVALGEGAPIGTPVALVGTGEGLPLKIARGGSVQAALGLPSTGFKSNLDAFLGSSGSGVFSEEGSVIGVLASGQDDFRAEGDCRVTRTLADTAGDETAYWARLAVTRYCAIHPERIQLCGEDQHAGPSVNVDQEGTATGAENPDTESANAGSAVEEAAPQHPEPGTAQTTANPTRCCLAAAGMARRPPSTAWLALMGAVLGLRARRHIRRRTGS